jgi:hypothetical protein
MLELTPRHDALAQPFYPEVAAQLDRLDADPDGFVGGVRGFLLHAGQALKVVGAVGFEEEEDVWDVVEGVFEFALSRNKRYLVYEGCGPDAVLFGDTDVILV